MAWLAAQTSTDWQDFLSDLLTFAESYGWTRKEYSTSVGGDGNVDQWIGMGSGGGSDEIYVGIRTFYNSSANAYNFELAGFTGYSSGSGWNVQPGISPGRYDDAANRYGAYLPLDNSTITWWASSTAYRIYAIVKIGTYYGWLYLGWGNPYASSGEFTYPLVVGGTTAVYDTRYNSNRVSLSGLPDPQGYNDGATAKHGPMMLRHPDGVWRTYRNAYEGSGNTRNEDTDRVVWPCGTPALNTVTLPDEADRWYVATMEYSRVIPQTTAGTQTSTLYKTDDSGGDIVPLHPCTLLSAVDADDKLIACDLDDIFWVSAEGGQTDGPITAEDTITDGGDTYYVFPFGNRSAVFNFGAIKAA